jgi:hypothetical protein
LAGKAVDYRQRRIFAFERDGKKISDCLFIVNDENAPVVCFWKLLTEVSMMAFLPSATPQWRGVSPHKCAMIARGAISDSGMAMLVPLTFSETQSRPARLTIH